MKKVKSIQPNLHQHPDSGNERESEVEIEMEKVQKRKWSLQ
jgi:hypothetical protein